MVDIYPPITQRVKTTAEVAVAFKQQFMKTLGSRLEPPICFPADVPNDLLCNFYDALPHSRKRGIWPEVAGQINKDEKWAAKHYLNSFRRALFPEPLSTQNKEDISNLVKKLMLKHYDKHSIVEEAKRKYQDTKIFPDAIQSYVFQTIVRLQRNQYLQAASKNSTKPTNQQKIIPVLKQQPQTKTLEQLTHELNKMLEYKSSQKIKQQQYRNNIMEEETVNITIDKPEQHEINIQQTTSLKFNMFSLGNNMFDQIYNGGGFAEFE
ncbi:Conserved_hypothetical protein [Hexamita inflata]|uniref:Uncharacterized protein n=1 Tax=Hexamita inflata TaxID=28002 RepID=A0AA86UG66_9EUKA|nr:Conserved hypothetical protein [Hexamita inflata]